jgi:predicted glycosyltransferase
VKISSNKATDFPQLILKLKGKTVVITNRNMDGLASLVDEFGLDDLQVNLSNFGERTAAFGVCSILAC